MYLDHRHRKLQECSHSSYHILNHTLLPEGQLKLYDLSEQKRLRLDIMFNYMLRILGSHRLEIKRDF